MCALDWLGVREDTGNGRRSCRVTKGEKKKTCPRFGNIRSLKHSTPHPNRCPMEALVAKLSDDAHPRGDFHVHRAEHQLPLATVTFDRQPQAPVQLGLAWVGGGGGAQGGGGVISMDTAGALPGQGGRRPSEGRSILAEGKTL